MVVLAASIVTKTGKPVISRQFREMPRARIESLLTAFPKLIPANSQHTSVETPDVRYVYQPLDDLYILVITNKASNILQDIETLHLFARVVTDFCRTAEEKEILKYSFELLGAFDEVVSLGFREHVNLNQVRSILEMESHEEKIQDIIAKNKEAEAKEELKRRAKQMEMQRREQQRRAAQGGGMDYGGGFGATSNSGGYTPVSRFDAPSPTPRTESPAPKPKAPAFKGTGMKLGAAKKTKQAEMIDALGAERDTPRGSRAATPSAPPEAAGPSKSDLVPVVAKKGVHIQVTEHLSIKLARDGALKSLDLKGDLQLECSDASLGPLRIQLAEGSNDGKDLQWKQHPKVAKFEAAGDRVIAQKNPNEKFPAGQALALLRWRLTKKDETYLPLSINCWPTPGNNGTCDVVIEFELDNDKVTLYDLNISIPLPSGSYPTVSSSSGNHAFNASTHSLDWSTPIVSSEEGTSSGSLEFNVGGDDPSMFFPVRVEFTGTGSLAEVQVKDVLEHGNEGNVDFSQENLILVDEFLVE